MADDEEVSSTVVRDYFIKNGGKVKRHDLFDHFRTQLDNSSDEGKLKNRFGDIVNSLASLQNIEGEKYFVLKKTRNGTTPVQMRRPLRAVNNQRKEKGVSLPASMRSFRFSSAEDSPGSVADSRSRSNSRSRQPLKSDSLPNNVLLKRNNSDTSLIETGQENDSGVDTALSSLQSESPQGSRHGSLPKNTEPDQLSQHSTDTGISGEDDQYDHDLPSHMLSAFEKSWMMASMTGNKANIICLLDENINIVVFKDFVMGYSALHWAAKQGNEDIFRVLVQSGADLNAKSNGGYTALHLASMHGQFNIINILIDEYNVDVHIRDHSGKEAKDVVKKNAPDQIKQKLRDPVAAIALQDLEKKLPNSSGKIKKLGKMLTRKHHNPSSNMLDGAEQRRSFTDSVGSLDHENNVDHEEQVSDDTKSDNEANNVTGEDSFGQSMESEDALEEDTNLALENWERENTKQTVND